MYSSVHTPNILYVLCTLTFTKCTKKNYGTICDRNREEALQYSRSRRCRIRSTFGVLNIQFLVVKTIPKVQSTRTFAIPCFFKLYFHVNYYSMSYDRNVQVSTHRKNDRTVYQGHGDLVNFYVNICATVVYSELKIEFKQVHI